MNLQTFGVQVRGRNIKEITTVDDMRESKAERLARDCAEKIYKGCGF